MTDPVTADDWRIKAVELRRKAEWYPLGLAGWMREWADEADAEAERLEMDELTSGMEDDR